MQIDYIPIYVGEKIPTEEKWFHSEGEIPKGATNTEHFRDKMIEAALESDYLRHCDAVIIIEDGKVIGIEKREPQLKVIKLENIKII